MTYPNTTEELLAGATAARAARQESINASAEFFNIFSILRLEHDEEGLHSRMIAALLDPRGHHGRKTFFLRKFLEHMKLPSFGEERLSDARVYTEEYIGPVAPDYSSGGSIDIVIKIPDATVIVIENKINAGDQPKQLIRYMEAYPQAYLLYLTRHGTLPSTVSTHDDAAKAVIDFGSNEKFSCVSYREQVLGWLQDCCSEVVEVPVLHETLAQYISVVLKITLGLTDNTMAEEIADKVVSSWTNLESFFTLRTVAAVKAVEHKLLYQFIDDLTAGLKSTGLHYSVANIKSEFGHKATPTKISYDLEGTSFIFELGFETWRQGLRLGIRHPEPKEEIHTSLSRSLSISLGKDMGHPDFLYLLQLKDSKLGDEYLSNWQEGSMEVWGAVQNGIASGRVIWYFKAFLDQLKATGLI